jgi:hypothetical protein
MPNYVQASTLVQRVRQRANLEGATAFVTDAEIVDHLNVAAGEFQDLIRAGGGQDYYRKDYFFQTVDNLAAYDLPKDCVSIISVDAQLNSSQAYVCLPYMEEQRNMYRWLTYGWVLGQPVYYRRIGTSNGDGQQINFIPTPNGNYSVTIHYVPSLANIFQIDATTNTARGQLDDVNGWSEFLVCYAASNLAIKDGQFDLATYLDGRKEKIAERIRQMAPQMDAGMPERVHDVEGVSGGYWNSDW